ncbi:MAG: four helix bundle protein [Bacteroidota bacterium]
MKTFEELNIWKLSKTLCVNIYSLKNQKYVKDYGIKDQIQRASVSIMSNIAEGFERGSNKDFIKFLYYSKASCGELRSLLTLSSELGYLTLPEYNQLHKMSIDLSKQISNFIKYLAKN